MSSSASATWVPATPRKTAARKTTRRVRVSLEAVMRFHVGTLSPQPADPEAEVQRLLGTYPPIDRLRPRPVRDREVLTWLACSLASVYRLIAEGRLQVSGGIGRNDEAGGR